MSNLSRILGARLLCVLLLVLASFSAHGGILVVNTLADGETDAGMVSLRDAMEAARTGAETELGDLASDFNVIDLSGLTGAIELEGPLPVVVNDVHLIGPGADQLTIVGGGAGGIFFVEGGHLGIAGVTLSGGLSQGGAGGLGLADGGGGAAPGMGGAILVDSGSHASLFDCIVADNSARGGAGGAVQGSGSFGGGGGGGFGEPGMPSVSGQSYGGAGGNGGPFGQTGGSGGTVGGAGLAGNGGPGGGGGGGGTGVATRAGHGGFAGGGGGAGRARCAAGPAGNGGFGGGGGGGTVCNPPDDGSVIVASGGSGGTFGGAGGDGVEGQRAGGGGGAGGLGGALFVRSGATLESLGCSFQDNTAQAGAGGVSQGNDGNPGRGKGGALFIMNEAIAVLEGVSFQGNLADDAQGHAQDNDDLYGATQSGQLRSVGFSQAELLVAIGDADATSELTLVTSDGLAATEFVEFSIDQRRPGSPGQHLTDDGFNAGSADQATLSVDLPVIEGLDELFEVLILELTHFSGAMTNREFRQVVTLYDPGNGNLAVEISMERPFEIVITVTNLDVTSVEGVNVSHQMPGQFSQVLWHCVPDPGAQCPVSGSGDIDVAVDLPPGGAVNFFGSIRISQRNSGLKARDLRGHGASCKVLFSQTNNTGGCPHDRLQAYRKVAQVQRVSLRRGRVSARLAA